MLPSRRAPVVGDASARFKDNTMPSTQPKFDDLLPPLDGRPLSRFEYNEIRPVRLALAMVVAVLHQGSFLEEHRPIQGGYDSDMRWLFEHLAPLARVSITVRRIRTLFDPLRYSRAWSNTGRVRRNLRSLASDAVLLASVIEAGRASSPPPHPAPGRPGHGRQRR
jgi:hypothetical protein